MKIIDFDHKMGMAFQGDVAIVPLPKSIKISTDDEFPAVDGKLILQHGEVTGHHHAILLHNNGRERHLRDDKVTADIGSFGDAIKSASPKLRSRLAGKVGSARMYRDQSAAAAMQKAGILERTDLCVGFLRVEGAPMVVTHQEHDGIRLPIGDYYIGRQIESAGAEERVVQD